MLCQLSYRGDGRARAQAASSRPASAGKSSRKKESGGKKEPKTKIQSHARRDSNPQPPDSKSGALSIAPRALDATDGGPADAVARFGPLHKGGRIGGRHLTAQIAREKKNFCFRKKKIYTTTERFELPRAEPNRFLIDRLNHSAKLP